MSQAVFRKIKNDRKKLFDHSCNEYYELTLDNGTTLMFTQRELNNALERSKRWKNHQNLIDK